MILFTKMSELPVSTLDLEKYLDQTPLHTLQATGHLTHLIVQSLQVKGEKILFVVLMATTLKPLAAKFIFVQN